MYKKSGLCGAVLVLAAISYSAAQASDDISLDKLAVSMEQATAIALQQVTGSVVGAEVESEDGQLVWEVEVLTTDGETYEVEIDAVSAEVLEVELDD